MTTPRSRPTRVALLVAIASALGAGTARAQTSPRPPGCARAAPTIELAVREREAGRTDAALAVLEDLYTRCSVPQVAAQLALAESDARRFTRAWIHLQAALAHDDDPWVRTRRAALVIARTEIRARMGSLVVRTSAPGAELFVDGERLGLTAAPDAYLVGAGELRVEVRVPGFPAAQRTVTVDAGRDVVLDVPMALPAVEPPSVAPVIAPAAVRATPDEGASRAGRYVGYGLLGLGAASAVAGVAFAVITATQASALQGATTASPGAEGAFVRFVTAPGYTATDRSTDTACAAAASDASADGRAASGLCADHGRSRALAWGLGLAGAAAAASGVVLVLLRPGESRRSASMWLAPVLGSATGVELHGAF